MANGIKLRGVAGDVDRVSVQSSESPSHLLTRRRWRVLPAQWTEVTIGRDELTVLKCNDGEAVVELKSLGGQHGDLIIDLQDAGRMRMREGQVVRLRMERNRAVFLRTQDLRYPRGPGQTFVV